MPERRVVRPERPVWRDRRPAPKAYQPTVVWRTLKSSFKGLAIVALIGGALWLTSIQHLTITGNQALSASQIREMVAKGLGDQLFGRSLLTLNSGRLAGDLTKEDYRIKNVTISRQWPHGLAISITERHPALNWVTQGQAYLLDYDGSIIGPSDEPGLPAVTDSTNLPVKKGDKVVPSSFITFTAQLAEQMPKVTQLKIVSMMVPDTTSEVYVLTDKGYSIKFDTTREVGGQLGDLVNVLKVLQQQNKTPTQYIDLRIPGKAYWL